MQFDELGNTEVPPPPPHLARQVHERLNRALLLLHFADLFLRALPWVAVRLIQPVTACARYTLTGRFGRTE
jgi:hypothetical protein